MRSSALYVNVRRLVVDQAYVPVSAQLADAVGRALQAEVFGGVKPASPIPRAIAGQIAQRLGDSGAVTNARSNADPNRVG
jgi:hypothetical protein